MRLSQIVRLLQASAVTVGANTDLDFQIVCAADLMSDVLAFARPGSLLLTGLANQQVIRTAEVAGIPAVVFVRGKDLPPDLRPMAEDARIVLFRTSLTMFEACGRLYQAGLHTSERGDPGMPGQ